MTPLLEVLFMQANMPFFTNDQWGLLKVLVIIVLPLAGWVWGLERRKERGDITQLGQKVDRMDTRLSLAEGAIASQKESYAEDRLMDQSRSFEMEKRIGEQQTRILRSLDRIMERLDIRDEQGRS